jgi:hypothetical protein
MFQDVSGAQGWGAAVIRGSGYENNAEMAGREVATGLPAGGR